MKLSIGYKPTHLSHTTLTIICLFYKYITVFKTIPALYNIQMYRVCETNTKDTQTQNSNF